MNLYDSIIEKIDALTGNGAKRVFKYDESKAWRETKEFELILQKDMAYELGGDNKPAVNFTCVTTNADFFNGDEVVVIGEDLPKLAGSVPYARIAVLLTDELGNSELEDNEAIFRSVQAMDFVKYRVYPEGYMVRTSGQTGREQVRISKKALKEGMNFEKIGATFIKRYKVNKQVKNVKLIFVTDPNADYKGLTDSAKKVYDITHSLSKILEGLPTECASCSIKEICDEVEGMKELHFGKKSK